MSLHHRGIGMTSQRTRERLMKRLEEQGISDVALLHAMRSIPRHIFVDEALASRAYENTALPIGFGQTISQPFVVAAMTQVLLDTGPMSRVLEIGGGCGYQSAVLARVARQVYTIERIAALANRLRTRLYDLKISNVRVRHGDGRLGWPAHAPFDAILVAAAAATVPTGLLDQLVVGGRAIMPIGRQGEQMLTLIRRTEDGYTEEALQRVSFVPLLENVD